MGNVAPAAAIVLLLCLAGCGSPQPAPSASGGRIVEVEGGEAIEIDNGTAALRGTVLNDIGFALRDVHVALIDTDNAARTDRDGRFVITGAAPGPYTLRADHPDYLSVQETIELRADAVLSVEVIMLPRQSAGPGYREHIHDLWAGQDSVVIVDQTFRWASHEAGYTGHHCVFADRSGVWEPPNLRVALDEPHQTVYQGTQRIDVVLDWTSTDSHYESLAFAWSGANSSHHWVSPWIGKGETFSIPVSPAMWDSSHQQFSLWDFWVCRDRNTPGSDERTLPFLGDVRVTMTMFRGEAPIPPEPAHPLFWQNGTELPLVTAAQKRFLFPGGVGSVPQVRHERTGTDSRFMVRAAEAALVPPGTGWIEARLDWTYSIQGNPHPGVGETTPPWRLAYKPANQAIQGIQGPGDLAQALLVEEGAGFAVFEIEVQPEQTDAFYQKVSNWYFYISPAGSESESTWINPCGCDVTVTLDASVHQRPDFEEG